MNPSERRPRRFVGILFLALGAALNQKFAAWILTDDWQLSSTRNLGLVWGLQGFLGVVGIFYLVRPRRLASATNAAVGTSLLLLISFGTFGTLRATRILKFADEAKLDREIARMNASETLHLNLASERLKLLSKDLPNLGVPGWRGREVFCDAVSVIDLVPESSPTLVEDLDQVGARILEWPLGEEREVARDELDLLRPLLARFDFVERGKFYLVGGDFPGESRGVWDVAAGFKAFGRTKEGTWVKAKGELSLRWQLAEGMDPMDQEEFEDFDSWSIRAIRFESFQTHEAAETLFSEVLESALPDRDALAQARRNRAQEMIVEKVHAEASGDEWQSPHPFFSHAAASESPAVSVVDLNRDGFDDFYAMPRYGPNQLFLNQGDGTFREMAGEVGLDVSDHCTAALFADFDNDDDDDLFLGRSLARGVYFENVGGRFEDRTEQVFGDEAPFFAMTASAADIDGDGLLDLYVGTYAATLLIKDIRARKRGGLDGMLFPEYLTERQARRLFALHFGETAHPIRNRFGPPNHILRNLGGGRFERLEDSPIATYRNTYQASFADYDGDGDPDLYVANDFSPNDMFRNDDGLFVDVTEETNAADIGFGMGVTWGDFDRDGDQDAYISNMFSKAGNRILPMVDVVDDRFLRMAAGNSLLELEDGRFSRVSSIDGPGFHVELGGWSWGSQFVDVDNDGWLDLYALSGYYSAPPEISAGHDL